FMAELCDLRVFVSRNPPKASFEKLAAFLKKFDKNSLFKDRAGDFGDAATKAVGEVTGKSVDPEKFDVELWTQAKKLLDRVVADAPGALNKSDIERFKKKFEDVDVRLKNHDRLKELLAKIDELLKKPSLDSLKIARGLVKD